MRKFEGCRQPFSLININTDGLCLFSSGNFGFVMD